MSKIRFRPHHFLCTVGFQGKGYSEAFVAGFARIAAELRDTPAGDSVLITVVERETDSICNPCPNRRDSLCETETKIQTLDSAHARVLGLRAGDSITWGEAKDRIKKNMTLENFHAACEPCSWKQSGICEKALMKLKTNVGLFLFTSLILAATPGVTRADPASDYEGRRNSIRTKIVGKLKAPKSAKTLQKASALFEQGKFEEVLTTIASVEKDADFSDHAIALKGSSNQRLAEALIDAAEENSKKSKKVDWKKVEALSTKSIQAWTQILETHLYSPWWANAPKEIGKAELTSALSHVGRKQNVNAVKLFEKAFQRLQLENATYLVRPTHLQKYGELCLKKKTELCTSWIVKWSNTYSKNSAESKILAKLFPTVVEAAKPTFANSKVTTGYKQKDADEMAFDQIFPQIVEEDFGTAADSLKKFLDEYPRSAHRFRARYWLAYALEKKKGLDEAKPHYEQLVRETPLTVYGLLAMVTLKQNPEGRFKGTAPELASQDDLQTPVEAARLSRARKLLAAKADKLAAFDIRSIKSRDTASGPYLLWLASFAAASGSHLSAFSILSDLIARMDENVYTPEGLDLVFPVVDWAVIEKQAAAAGMDPILILSLIKQESAFDREAGSSVGAAGYMQLMPFTASDVEPDVERSELLEAETNIRIGTKYLKKILDRFKGNAALALAGYNAGPTAVDRWIREGRASKSFLEFVEQIPYKETRDYVGTIYRNYVWYRFRLKGERVTTPEFFWPGPAGKAEAPASEAKAD